MAEVNSVVACYLCNVQPYSYMTNCSFAVYSSLLPSLMDRVRMVHSFWYYENPKMRTPPYRLVDKYWVPLVSTKHCTYTTVCVRVSVSTVCCCMVSHWADELTHALLTCVPSSIHGMGPQTVYLILCALLMNINIANGIALIVTTMECRASGPCKIVDSLRSPLPSCCVPRSASSCPQNDLTWVVRKCNPHVTACVILMMASVQVSCCRHFGETALTKSVYSCTLRFLDHI